MNTKRRIERASEKQRAAQDQHYASCMKPSNHPLPAWLMDPKFLPKRPPARK